MAIKIQTKQCTKDLTGKSHWWGFPDLPQEVSVPCRSEKDEEGLEEMLTFICQINLADLKPYDTQSLLPRQGMLYFFADLDYFLGDLDAEAENLGFWNEEAFRVIYAPNIEKLYTHEIRWADGSIATLPAETIHFETTSEDSDGHKLLGTPFFEEVSWEASGMISLLQIDEDDNWGLRLYDMGNLNFLISPEALAAADFSKVKLYFHSM